MKQVILVRQDLKMPKGKLATQCSHASVGAVLKSKKTMISEWSNSGSKKSVLKVKGLDELKKYYEKAKKSKLTVSLVNDAGKTFFKKPTITCFAIGPDREEKIDRITKDLHLL